MVLKPNLEYWKISLENPEPLIDDYYLFDKVIVEDQELIKKIERLRELIISYCIVVEKDKIVSEKILDEIYTIITSINKIQYTEFIAFWKVLDISFSIFSSLSQNEQKDILAEILKRYCIKRRKLYDKLGYSNITVQALYDSGVSRKKGITGIAKVIDMVSNIFDVKDKNIHLKAIEELINTNFGYFLPDKSDKQLFKEFCRYYKVVYQFSKDHQEKYPDIVLKINDHFFIIEAKHIKETGGAQDKQIVEIIEFIKYSEKSESIHYVVFLDGIYFNNFINPKNSKIENKIKRQKEDIEKYLKENPNNYFVNTAGLKELFRDLKRKI
jgi:hypothetical protein